MKEQTISIRECSIESEQFFRAVIKSEDGKIAIESSNFTEKNKKEILIATVSRIGFVLANQD